MNIPDQKKNVLKKIELNFFFFFAFLQRSKHDIQTRIERKRDREKVRHYVICCILFYFLLQWMQLTGFGSANICGCVTCTVVVDFCPCCFVNESKSHLSDGFSNFISGNAKPSSSDFGDRFLNKKQK